MSGKTSSESPEPLAGRRGAPHSQGTAYKPPCGEIAMCARVGRMGPISVDGPGNHHLHVYLDPSGLILSWGLRDWLGAYRHAVFIAAPSMTTPAVTISRERQAAFAPAPRSSSCAGGRRCALRGRGTRERAPSPADARSHSQASWIIVVRSRGLPDCEMPCSRSTDPLCQGVGARPA